MTKDAVLDLLRQNADTFVSGAEIGRQLSVSRTAVWKAIEQLKEDGYRIDSVPNKGYLLSSVSDVLSEEGIARYLKDPRLPIRVYPSITSTNTVLKAMAADGVPAPLALIAGEQTNGRGRMGRSFYSPSRTGLYMSLLLRPGIAAADVTGITACAAVAVAQTIEQLSGQEAAIKWVNDVYVQGKKVCGILTEASIDCETGVIHYLIIGIGINTALPEKDFPEELQAIAGAAFEGEPVPDLRCRLAAGVLDRLMAFSDDLTDERIFTEYKKRLLVLGRPINILAVGKEPEPATVLDLERDYALLVRCEDGSIRRLNSGEVSVRLTK
ncbi:MAG: biotin--[Oscillospiraceae bacterium]|nr:biotin--[acetyl-CoA-carboxylase] ligase [Oscillospiraceae bacterium]